MVRSISREMSESAILSLGESLELMKGTIETLYKREAEYQKLVADEIAVMENPEKFIVSYNKDKTIVKMSYVPAGKTEGISNTGEVFLPEELDFSGGYDVEGVMISRGMA